ncbi:hypothetical protein ZWY2020_009063 [Hordeum vulgare]|nr:hypothetical protein ZWY2020_009063 [Hordeum vulgare]
MLYERKDGETAKRLGNWSSRWRARPGGRERSRGMRWVSRRGGQRVEGRDSRRESVRSGSALAVASKGRRGSEERTGWEAAYHSRRRRRREVAGDRGSARRRPRRCGVSGREESVHQRRQRSNGASSSGHNVTAAARSLGGGSPIPGCVETHPSLFFSY